MSTVTCKCVKSKCRSMDCECFRQGITCKDDCFCIDCKNTMEHAHGQTSSKKENKSVTCTFVDDYEHDDSGGEVGGSWATLSTHPLTRRHKALDHAKMKKGKGCACMNSNCLKKYCVCFNAGVECTVGRCKCRNCKNPLGAVSNYSSRGGTRDAAPVAESASIDGVHLVRTVENTKCRCTKTQCLKLYCDCFRQDLACNENCTCIDCKNTEEHGGITGERTRARNEIMKTRPHVFNTPKKKSGVGCSCLRNKCRTKYCDCNNRGVGCDPAVCSCINCENMMKPRSEMIHDGLEPVQEDETEVFAPEVAERCSVKGLGNFSHRIDDFDLERLVQDPGEKLSAAYEAREAAVKATEAVVREESEARDALRDQIRRLEVHLQAKVKGEDEALRERRLKTDAVMRLEMDEPCRWNATYRRLKSYVMRTGDLPPVPSACVAEADRRLSIWIQEMKSLVYSKSERMINFPHRVEALESLGIEWIESSEDRWNSMYAKLAEYKEREGTAELPSFMRCRKSKDKDLAALRHWADVQEADAKSGAMARRRDRLKKLQDLGLSWTLPWENEWGHHVVELLKFRSKYGHLNVFVASGLDDRKELCEFVTGLLERLKKGGSSKLTRKELDDLGSKGLLGDLKSMSQGKPGRPNAFGIQGGGEGIMNMQIVPLERVKEVNYWAGMLEQLRAYKEATGTLSFPPRRGHSDHTRLRDWVEAQRRSHHNKTLEEGRVRELRNLGLEFDPWNVVFAKLRKFKREAGTVRLPKDYKSDVKGGAEDEELAELCKWVQEQIRLYRKDELDADRKKKLRKLGVYLTKGHMGKMPWEDRFEEMMEYYHTNKTCLPKRDGPLRQWVLELVDLIQNGYVSARRQKLIDQERIGPYLRPDVIFKDSAAASSSSVAVSKKRKAGDDVKDGNKKAKMGNVSAV